MESRMGRSGTRAKTLEVHCEWEIIDDDGDSKLIPLTSDGYRLVSWLIERAEKAELAERKAWAVVLEAGLQR